MIVKNQNFPSFASIISVLSIILYCLGFLRVELELNEHKKRLNALENVATKPSNSPDVSELITNAPGKLYTEKQLKEVLLFLEKVGCFVLKTTACAPRKCKYKSKELQ